MITGAAQTAVPTSARCVGPTARTWHVAEACVLRLAGFSFCDLTALRMPRTAEVAQELIEAEAFVRHQPRHRQRAAAGAIRARQALAHLQRCERVLEATFDRELKSARAKIRDVARSPRFLEAVLLSNPEAYRRIVGWLACAHQRETSNTRRVERLVARYLQRFCAKNESTSFFGPTAVGQVTSGLRAPVTGVPTGRLSRRVVEFANWAADELIRAAGARARVPSRAPRPLAAAIGILEAEGVSPEVLVASRTLDNDLERMGTRPRARTHAHARKHEIVTRMDTLFAQTTGAPAARKAGRVYGDRRLIHEDAEYRFDGLRVSRDFLDDVIASCQPFFDAIAALSALQCEGQRRAFGQWLGRRSGMSVSETARMAANDPDGLRHCLRDAHERWWALAAPALSSLRALVDDSELGEVRLSEGRCDELRRAIRAVPACDDWPQLFSVDLLVGARSQDDMQRGSYQAVVGELHPAVGIDGFYARVSRSHAQVREAVRRALEAASHGYQPLALLTPMENKTFATLDLGYPAVTIGGVPSPGDRTLSLDDLRINVRGGLPYLEGPGSDRPYFIPNRLPNRLNVVPLKFFSIPDCTGDIVAPALVHARAHIPRIAFERTVWQRESWIIPTERIAAVASEPSDRRRFVAARRVFDALDLPRHVFVRFAGERKPFYLDCESHLLIENIVRRSLRYRAGTTTLSEMLPDPDGLWLKDDLGRHTSELRVCLYDSRKADGRTRALSH